MEKLVKTNHFTLLCKTKYSFIIKITMRSIEKYLQNSTDKDYYESSIDKLDDEQKKELEELLQNLDEAGAKEPLGWALSQITEGIPQFGRFVFLRELYNIINDTEENLALADDIDEGYEEDIFEVVDKLKETLGEQKFDNFLKAFTKGVMWQVINLIDEANHNQKGEPKWSLKEIKNDNTIGKTLGGLHESFNQFEDELQ